MLERKILLNDDIQEVHLSLKFESSDEGKASVSEALTHLKGMQVLCVEVFAPSWAGEALDLLKGEFENEFPINWIYPLDEEKTPVLAGIHITALCGAVPEIINCGDGIYASVYSDNFIKYCRTFGVVSQKNSDNGYDHTLENLSQLEAVLKKSGFSYNDVVRTWFYNDDILQWYDGFNLARTKFYDERGIFDKLLPASTGIGSPNPQKSKMESGAIALKACGNSDWSVVELESPMQGGAPEYGSSFSRAIAINTPKSKRIMVSGTASIAPEGHTLYVGDIEKQVELTMNVIEAILKSHGMDLTNTVRSIIYCLSPDYYEAFKNWCAKRKLEIPHCPSYSIVCRDNLLFEVELDSFVVCEEAGFAEGK